MAMLFAPSFWIGLGALLAIVWFVTSHRGRSKKMNARLERITRKNNGARTTAEIAQSLRRQTPGQDGMFMRLFGGMGSIARLRARFEIAGMTLSPQTFFLRSGMIVLIIGFGVCVGLGKPLLLGLLVGILAGLALPHMYVSRRIRKRQRVFMALFPEAIDLMVRGLRAGLPIAESFINVSHELPPPMGDTFGQISQTIMLGVPFEKALTDAAKKLGITEFNFFVTSVILQRETGGNLGEILNTLSETLRQRHMMRLKITALSSEARASAYIVGALPFAVFFMLLFISPDYLNPLFDDYRGNIALAAAGVSMGLGAFVMKKMTQMEI